MYAKEPGSPGRTEMAFREHDEKSATGATSSIFLALWSRDSRKLAFDKFTLLSFLGVFLSGCGGVALQTSNTVVATPSTITFGNVAVGQTAGNQGRMIAVTAYGHRPQLEH